MSIPELQNLRTKYPQYKEIDDSTLAAGLAKKYPDSYGYLVDKVKQSSAPTPQGIKDIATASREGNFASPNIQSANIKQQIPFLNNGKNINEGQVTESPRARTDTFLKPIGEAIANTAVAPFNEAAQAGRILRENLQNSPDVNISDWRTGGMNIAPIAEGGTKALSAALHLAMTPFTVPLNAADATLRTLGAPGNEIATGLERTMNLPFEGIKTASEGYNKAFELLGIKLPKVVDEKTDKALNELATEVVGLYLLGKGHKEIKSFVENKIPVPTLVKGEVIQPKWKAPEIAEQPKQTAGRVKPVQGKEQIKTNQAPPPEKIISGEVNRQELLDYLLKNNDEATAKKLAVGLPNEEAKYLLTGGREGKPFEQSTVDNILKPEVKSETKNAETVRTPIIEENSIAKPEQAGKLAIDEQPQIKALIDQLLKSKPDEKLQTPFEKVTTKIEKPIVGKTQTPSQIATEPTKPLAPAVPPIESGKSEVMPSELHKKTFVHETDSPIFDKFDMSKVGSGQGESWLGRGIYLNEKGGFKIEKYGKNKIEASLTPNAKIFEVKNTPDGEYRDTFVEYAVKNGIDRGKAAEYKKEGLWLKNLLPRDILKRDSEDAIAQLKKDGYDGLYQDGELVIYNDKVLKINHEKLADRPSVGTEKNPVQSEPDLVKKPLIPDNPPSSPKKEPWEMSRDEFIKSRLEGLGTLNENRLVSAVNAKGAFRIEQGNYHQQLVQKAINEGEISSHPDYPDLAKKGGEDSLIPSTTKETPDNNRTAAERMLSEGKKPREIAETLKMPVREVAKMQKEGKPSNVENLKNDLIELKDNYNSSEGSEKTKQRRPILNKIQELRAQGVDAKFEQGQITIDGKPIRKVGVQPAKVDITKIEVRPEAGKRFEELDPEVRNRQEILAENFVTPEDLPDGHGQKVLEKGIEQIKNDDGQEQLPEAKIVRDAAEHILENGKDVTLIKGSRGAKTNLSPEEVKGFVDEKLTEKGDTSFDFGNNLDKDKNFYSSVEKDAERLTAVNEEIAQLVNDKRRFELESEAQNIPSDKINKAKVEINKIDRRIAELEGEKNSLKSQTSMFSESSAKKQGQGDIFRIIPEDMYKKALDNWNNPNGINLKAGVDPIEGAKRLRDLTIIGAYHLENVVRSGVSKSKQFAEFSKAMIEALGDGVKPKLNRVYQNVLSQHQKDLEKLRELPKGVKGKPDLHFGGVDARIKPEIEDFYLNHKKEYDQVRGGKIGNKQLIKKGLKYASKLTDADILELKNQTKFGEVEAVGSHIYGQHRIEQLINEMNEIKLGTEEGFKARKQKADLAAEMFYNIEAPYSHFARGLQVKGKLATDNFIDALRKLRDEAQKYDPQLAKDLSDKLKAAEYEPTLKDKLAFWYYNSLLSDPTTDVRNITGNTTMLGAELVSKAFSQSPGETLKMLSDVRKGFKSGVKEMADISHQRVAEDSKFVNSINKYDVHASSKLGKFGRSLLPTTRLSMEDAFFRGIAREVSKGTVERATAKKFGESLKDTQEQIKRVMDGDLEGLSDAKIKMIADGLEHVEKYTDYTTFRSELGSTAKHIEGIVRDNWAAKIIMPFVKIGANIIKAGTDYSPLGFGKEIIARMAGKEINQFELKDIRRRAIAGTLAIGVVINGVSNGTIEVTGQLPTNDFERELMQAKGYKANHIYLSFGGKKTGISYQNINPINIPLSIIGNYTDNLRFGKELKKDEELSFGDKLGKTILGSAATLADQSYMQGLNNLMDAMQKQDPGYFSTVAVGFIPNVAGLPKKVLGDNLSYKAKTFGEKVIRKVGLTEGMEPYVNIKGEEKTSELRGLPLPLSEIKDDKVLDFLKAKDLRISLPSANTKIGDEKLTPNEFTQYQKIVDKRVYATLLMRLPMLKRKDAERAQKMIDEISNSAKEFAKRQIEKSRK